MVIKHTNHEGLREDSLLDGRLRLLQPHRGVRVTTDTLLLAAAVTPLAGSQTVIEAGSGSGGAALYLAALYPDIRVTGIDSDSHIVDLASRNAVLNGFQDRVSFLHHDVSDRSDIPGCGRFDHALANPPYFEAETCYLPPAESRARAFVGGKSRLSDWIGFCLNMVRDKGSITFIHRADRLDELLSLLHGRAGEIALCPLWPRAGQPAKRVLVQGRKGMKGAAMLLPGLVLHDQQGGFTPEVDAILRGRASLDLTRAGWEKLCQSGRR